MENNTFKEQFEDFTINLKFSQAVNFILNKKYNIADALLFETISKYGDLPQLLNLYATSLAQQGRFAEAEINWKKALQIQPNDLHFQKAIEKIHELQKKKFLPFAFFNLGIKITIGICILLFIMWSIFSNINITNNVEGLSYNQNKILSAIQSNHFVSGSSTSESSILPKIVEEIHKNITGASLVEDKNSASIIFNNGLFDRETNLKDDSKILLVNLAHTLEPFSDQIRIIILGCTNNIPVPANSKYTNNISLAGARAEIIYNLFKDSAKINPENMLIGRYTTEHSPFSNTTFEDRDKNRTVIIKLSSGFLQ